MSTTVSLKKKKKVYTIQKEVPEREQDVRGIGEGGVHLSLQIHQEYTLINKSACRTPPETRLEYLTSRKKIYRPMKNLVG